MTTKSAKETIDRWLFDNSGITGRAGIMESVDRPFSPVSTVSSNASKGSRKRKCSWNNTQKTAKTRLWSWVSYWEKKTVEKHLHIFYDNDFSDPEEVLRNGEIETELTEDQKQYIDVLENYLKFSFKFSDLMDDDFKYFDSYSRMEATLLELENNIRTAKKPKEMKGEIFGVLKRRLVDFCNELRILMKKMKNNNGKVQMGFEGAFQDFVCSFAEMCCLKARPCKQLDQSVWLNLKGIATITSRPDCRFYKCGLNYIMSQTMFPVIQVKRGASVRSSYEDLSSLEPHGENRAYTSSDTSSLLSSPSSSRMGVSDVSLEGEKTSFEKGLNKRVLGQHAGELLLDLHKLREDEKSSKLTMPGMIVDGTKVYLTLLKITEEHYQKLKDNTELTDEDRAVIYYSKPYDILTEWKRNVLIKNFMRLNNAE